MYTYEEVIYKIEHARRFGRQPGVEVTARALEVLGHPERELPYIHVAGTNGKGSVCAFLGSILWSAGKKVGVFTSPHLIHFEERITVNGVQIAQEDVTRLGNRLFKMDFGVELTMFDYCLLMAVLYFGECGCEIAVMETGLGGRLDSTNALGSPLVAVITRIGLDHTAILGDTLAAIAAEKAGILKPGCTAVIGPQEDEAQKVLDERAAELGLLRRTAAELKSHRRIAAELEQRKRTAAELEQRRRTAEELELVKRNAMGGSQKIKAEKGETNAYVYHVTMDDVNKMHQYHLRMQGEYQYENAAIAKTVAECLSVSESAEEQFSVSQAAAGCLSISEESIRAGLEQAFWPGRMQLLSEKPFLLVDGAHNPNGVAALRRSLERAYPGERFHFLMGVMADKDYTEMIQELLPLAIDFRTVTPQSERAEAAEELAEIIREYGVPALAEGSLQAALKQMPTEEKTVAFGSLYFVGELCENYRAE